MMTKREDIIFFFWKVCHQRRKKEEEVLCCLLPFFSRSNNTRPFSGPFVMKDKTVNTQERLQHGSQVSNLKDQTKKVKVSAIKVFSSFLKNLLSLD